MININLLPGRAKKAPNYWRLAAAGVPLTALLVLGWLQFGVFQSERRLEARQAELQLEKAVLQKFVDEQNALQARRSSLSELQAVAEAVRGGRIVWSEQLFAMLEIRPPQGPGPASRIAFRQLEMRALDEATRQQRLADNTYEGLDAVAEMEVQGVAGSTEAVANYVRALQDSPRFAVTLRDVARDQGSRFYTFTLSVGAAAVDARAAEGGR